jgi:hypothetical protein
MALKPPVEVPQGAIRLNTDSQKLEFFAQDQWWEMATGQAMTTSMRGLYGGGAIPSPSPTSVNWIDMISMSTAGNAIDFGDLTDDRYTSQNAGSSFTRGLWGGSYTYPSPNAYLNTIDYVTIATQGNAIDFGDQTFASHALGGVSNEIRFVQGGGYNPSPTLHNTMCYVTISTTGNAADFGDLVYKRMGVGAIGNRTRGVWGGGSPNGFPTQGASNEMQYITFASTGNSVDFGDLYTGVYWTQGASNNVRGVWAGGVTGNSPAGPYTGQTLCQAITIPTLGNSVNWGDLTGDRRNGGITGSQLAGYIGGGEPARQTDIMKFSLIGDGAHAYSFGDLNAGNAYNAGVSNCHGGL